MHSFSGKRKMEMIVKDRTELSEREIRDAIGLKMSIWPPVNNSYTIDLLVDRYKEEPPAFDKVLLLYNEGVLIGHTEVFGREVKAGSRPVRNMALAGVCVLPEFRKRTLGSQLVKQAFSFVESEDFECSLFQTPVPRFYENLCCTIIKNTFINSKNTDDVAKNPWWDPYVMVYPADHNLGESIIDLNGSGY